MNYFKKFFEKYKKDKPDKQEEGMSRTQAINILFHIGNNIDRIADTEEDAETYIMAIEKAINALVYKK